MATTVATLRTALLFDDAVFRRGIGRATQSLNNFSRQATTVGRNLTFALTAPIGLLGVSSIKVFADFEKTLDVLGARSGATSKQMVELSQLSKKLGADLTLPGTSAADAARAMEELVKAGLSVEEAMAAARSTLQLSAAGQIENAEAAKISAAAMNSFKLSAKDLARVNDLLTNAANSSQAQIGDLARSIRQGGLSASTAGVSFKEFTAQLTIMGRAGIIGSDAGTAVKAALNQLAKPTKEARKEMVKLGLTFFDTAGNFKKTADLARDLQKAFTGMTKKQQLASAVTLAGTDGQRLLIALAQASTEAINAVETSLAKQGTAAIIAAAQNEGITGSLDAMKSAFETAQIAAIEPFADILRSTALRIGDLIGKFAELSPTVQRTFVALAGGLAVIGPLLFSVGLLAGAITSLRNAFIALKAVQAATWLAVGRGAVRLGLIAALVITLEETWRNNWFNIKETTAASMLTIGDTFSTFVDNVGETWSVFLDLLKGESTFAILRRTSARIVTDLGKIGETLTANTKEQFAFSEREAKESAERIKETLKKAAAEIANTLAEGGLGLPGEAVPDLGLEEAGKKAKQKAEQVAAAIERLRIQFLKVTSSTREAALAVDLFGKRISELTEKETAQLQIANKFDQAIRDRQESDRKAITLRDKINGLTERGRLALMKLTAATDTERVAIRQFGKELTAVNFNFGALPPHIKAAIAELVKMDSAAAAIKQTRKEAADLTKIMEQLRDKTRGVFRNVAKELDLQRDSSEQNRVAWELYGQSLTRIVSPASLAIIKLLAEQRDKVKKTADALKEQNAQIKASQQLGKQFADVLKQQTLAEEKFADITGVAAAADQLFKKSTSELTAVQMTAAIAFAARIQALKDQKTTVATTIALEEKLANATDNVALALLDAKAKTDEERIAIRLVGMELLKVGGIFDALPEKIKKVIAAIAAADEIGRTKEALDGLAQDTKGIFTDAFLSLDKGFSGFFDSVVGGFRNMLQQLAAEFLAAEVTKLIIGALGGDTSGITSVLGQAFQKKQFGGSVSAGQPVFAGGSHGPEVFIPGRSGRIAPLQEERAPTNNFVFNITTPDVAGFERSRSSIQADMAQVLTRAQRRNGM